MLGRPAMDSAEYLIERMDLPIQPEDYLAERTPLLEQMLTKAGSIAGAEAFTRELKARGIPIAVATSTDARLFAVKTGHHQEWFAIFDAIVCGDDARVARGKPAPDIFLAAAESLGVPPASCVVVEDSPLGVAAALAAGMKVIGFPDPRMDRRRFDDAHFVVASYDELSRLDLGVREG
jgi:pseudouridine-5'-monophosphatase